MGLCKSIPCYDHYHLKSPDIPIHEKYTRSREKWKKMNTISIQKQNYAVWENIENFQKYRTSRENK